MTERPYQGVVILGFPRSGTTLLRRLLDAHPQLCCPPETNILRACAAFLHSVPSPLGFEVGVATSLRFVGIQPEALAARVRQLAFDLYAEICEKAGKPIWVEKSALDFFHLDAIDGLLGEHCRYLWIKRDAADVVSSVQEYIGESHVYLPEFHEYICRYPAPVEAFAHAWADTQDRAADLAERRPERCFQLKYEDLVADPDTALRGILDFLAIEGDTAAMVAGLRQISNNIGFGDYKTYARAEVSAQSVGRRKDLPPRLLARVAEIVNPTMVRIGYEPIAVPERELRGDPTRQLAMHQFAVQKAAIKDYEQGQDQT